MLISNIIEQSDSIFIKFKLVHNAIKSNLNYIVLITIQFIIHL